MRRREWEDQQHITGNGDAVLQPACDCLFRQTRHKQRDPNPVPARVRRESRGDRHAGPKYQSGLLAMADVIEHNEEKRHRRDHQQRLMPRSQLDLGSSRPIEHAHATDQQRTAQGELKGTDGVIDQDPRRPQQPQRRHRHLNRIPRRCLPFAYT